MARFTVPTVLVVLVLLATSVFGASAFTSATVDRQANVNVATDSNAIVGLYDNTTDDIVQKGSAGELSIDFSESPYAKGANTNATFTLGDTASPVKTHAFNVTNNDDQTHDFTIDYTATNGDGNNLEFLVYDSTSTGVTKVGEVNAASTTQTVTLSSQESVYIVVVLDTGAGDGQVLSSGADLSGKIEITV